MVCYHPIKAYYPFNTVKDYHTGDEKRYIKFTTPICGKDYDNALDYVSCSI